MKYRRLLLLVGLLSMYSIGVLRANDGERFAFERWRDIAVLNGGRCKPLDTLAWESLRLIANRGSFTDPATNERLDPLSLYLKMFFDWSGWDNPQHERLLLTTDWRPEYFPLHKADKWDQAPIIQLDHPALRMALGLPEGGKHISPEQLEDAVVDDDRAQQKILFRLWALKLVELEESGIELTSLEKKGLELAHRFWTYEHQRMGRGLELIPGAGANPGEWMPLGVLMLTAFEDATDPGGGLRRAQKLLWEARTAYRAGQSPAFDKASNDLVELLRTIGETSTDYPSAAVMGIEVAYNHWAPFRFAWVLMLTAFISMLLCLGSTWKWFHRLAIGSYGAGIVALLIGFVMRALISGRPPVTNMYESVIYMGAGVAIFGFIFEWIYRKKYILTAAAAVSTVALVLADNCPAILDPSVRPLEPVLRSNFWLVTHVMTITLSYAAFALALGIANITLGYFLIGSRSRDVISALTRFTYKSIQVGVLLLAAGVILGGVWADYSWGRFWGWDPKEVWALIALLGYLAVLHARYAGLVGQRGLAALAVACFSLVVMAWYGVNFVLGAGLHSYGFGGGGNLYVYSGVAVQLLYAAIAASRTPAYGTRSENMESLENVESLRATSATVGLLPADH